MENFSKMSAVRDLKITFFESEVGIWLAVIVTQLFQNFILKKCPIIFKISKPGIPWFIKIDSVQNISMHTYVCVCVCPPPGYK